MKTLKTFIFILPLLFSCSPSPDVTKAKITIGASVSSSDFPGGLFILGHNIDSEIVFMKRIQSNDHEIEVDNGKWEFAAIGWDQSANNMQGIPKCFITNPLNLDGSEIDVTLEPSLSGCGEDPFNKDDENYNFANGSPKPLKFVSCAGLNDRNINKSNIDESYDCSDYPGAYRSYKVMLYDIDFAHEDHMAQAKNNPFESVCIQDGGADQLIDVGSNASPTIMEGIPQSIKAYETANCTGAHTQIDLNSGLHSANHAQNNAFIKARTNENFIYFDQDFCNQDAIASGTPDDGNGLEATPYIICNKTELENMSGTIHYQLGKDINAAGLSTNLGFTGTFNGNGKTISNLDASLFGTLTPSTIDMKISNFTVKNSTLAQSDNDLGVIAKNISVNGVRAVTIENISFDIITINNQNSSPSTVGLVTGLVNLTSSAKFSMKDIDVFHSGNGMNSVISASTSSNGTGGLIGRILNSTSAKDNADIEDIEVNNLNVIGTSGKVGGLVGDIYKAKLSTIQIKASTVSGKADAIGGIAGEVNYGIFNLISYSSDSGQAQNEIVCNTASGNLSVPQCSSIGGIIGYLKDDSVIDNAIANFKLHDSDDALEKLGGIVGIMGNGASDNLVKNSSAHIDIIANGTFFGGIIGYQDDSSLYQATIPNILSSSSYGSINTHAPNTINTYRGGLVGKLSNPTKIKHSGAFLTDLVGDSYIGGAVGFNAGSVEEVFVSISNIFAQDNGSDDAHKVGGLIGDNLPSGKVQYSFVINTDIQEKDGACDSSQECGFLIGSNTNTNTGSSIRASHFNSFSNSTIETNSHNGSTFKTIGGPSNNTGVATSPGNNYSVLNSASSAHSIYVDTFFDNAQFINIANTNDVPFLESSSDFGAVPVPVFVQKWFDLGFKDLGGGARFIAGNVFEPFIIENHNHWNKIQDNDFLLTKAFALDGDVNFSGEQFVPIGLFESGGQINCPLTEKMFTGIILASKNEDKGTHNNRLRNVSIDVNGSWTLTNCSSRSIGLIANVDHESQELQGIIGTPDNPLKLENIDIQNSADHTFNAIGGVVGKSTSSLISVHANMIELHNLGTNTSNVAGLVGRAQTLLVAASDITVDIDAPGIYYVGGLVANQSTTPFIALKNKITIDHLFGDGFVGGIGASITGSFVKLESNIINFKDTPNVIDAQTGQFGGFAGSIGSLAETSDNLVILKTSNFGANATTSMNFTGNTAAASTANNIYIGGTSDSSGADFYFTDIQSFLNTGSAIKGIYYNHEDSEFKFSWEQ